MLIRSLLEIGEPNHAALILADRAISYQQLDEQINQAIEQLIRLGFRKGCSRPKEVRLILNGGLWRVCFFLRCL